MFDKNRSIKVSERVFDLVKEELELLVENDEVHVDGWLETFNNCREQGYMMVVSDDYRGKKKKYMPEIFIWVAENRNSDDIVVYIDDSRDGVNNGITDKAYREAEYFGEGEYVEASEYIVNVIKTAYNKFNENTGEEE